MNEILTTSARRCLHNTLEEKAWFMQSLGNM
jgi:hypothetical protein